MKIRIRGNSIRYRLDKKDITVLQEQQQVEERTLIGAATLLFRIVPGDTGIVLATNVIELSIPNTQLEEWANTEQVGFSLELPNPDGSALKILIEKDFKCLTERDEDQSHAFDNPAQTC